MSSVFNPTPLNQRCGGVLIDITSLAPGDQSVNCLAQGQNERFLPLSARGFDPETLRLLAQRSYPPAYVCPNAAGVEPGFYALVKYFSAAQASKAQKATHGRGFFQSSPLKVKLSTKQYPNFLHNSKPLSRSKCQDLANHYLGFNGWSTHIVTLKDISNCDDAGRLSTTTGDPQEITLKYGCIMDVTFPQHGLSCRGVGVAEETVEGTGPDVVLPKRGKLQRWARDKAVVDAFEKVLLLVLGNGKVVVECRVERDDVLQDEDLKGLIKVNDIPWSQFDPDGQEENEDIPWDLSVNM
ncbi:RAD52 motif-containing protein 1 isoform X1 [Oncorhynchus keta]|uniref:RAD52 motif-containing protein 1 isoform X1 n=1 Tax=Oncorhynchus keta TaxID=8018 RepID=UPI0015F83B6A|nr:RAD52 motif-containing protein 1 isoform X1 [Oncorhynchus keta]